MMNRSRQLCFLVVLVVFFVSGVLKIMSPARIPPEILDRLSGLLSRDAASFLLERLAYLEICLVLGLLLPVSRTVSLVAATSYLFAGAVLFATAWEPGLPFPGCGCFGLIGDRILPNDDIRFAVARNMVLAVPAIWCLLSRRTAGSRTTTPNSHQVCESPQSCEHGPKPGAV